MRGEDFLKAEQVVGDFVEILQIKQWNKRARNVKWRHWQWGRSWKQEKDCNILPIQECLYLSSIYTDYPDDNLVVEMLDK